MKRFALVAALLGGVFGASQAQAVPVLPGNNPITVDFNKTLDSNTSAGAIIGLNNFVFNGKTVSFSIAAQNISDSNDGAIRLTAFGWDMNPDAISASDTSQVFSSAVNANLGSTALDLCLYGGSNCNGGSNGGLYDAGHASSSHPRVDFFNVVLTFQNVVTSLAFDTFDAKFQTDHFSSFDVAGKVETTPVPEPASVALLGVGMLGMVAVSRRRRLV